MIAEAGGTCPMVCHGGILDRGIRLSKNGGRNLETGGATKRHCRHGGWVGHRLPVLRVPASSVVRMSPPGAARQPQTSAQLLCVCVCVCVCLFVRCRGCNLISSRIFVP